MKAKIILPLFLCLSACLATEVRYQVDISSYQRLSLANNQLINLQVIPIERHRSGTQFFLFLLPFGSIYLNDISNSIYTEAFKELALRKYSINSQANRTLTISIEDTKLTAYDFLLTRKIVGRLEIVCRLYDKEQLKRSASVLIKDSELRRYAFEAQLRTLWDEISKSAITECLDKLALN